jgi:hypothetical protein
MTPGAVIKTGTGPPTASRVPDPLISTPRWLPGTGTPFSVMCKLPPGELRHAFQLTKYRPVALTVTSMLAGNGVECII